MERIHEQTNKRRTKQRRHIPKDSKRRSPRKWNNDPEFKSDKLKRYERYSTKRNLKHFTNNNRRKQISQISQRQPGDLAAFSQSDVQTVWRSYKNQTLNESET